MNPSSNRFARFWRIGFLLIVGGWLGWILIESDSIRQIPQLIASPAAWLFLISWAALPIGLALLWRWQLQLVSGKSIPMSSSFRIQGLAWAGRYLPGKAGLWIAKVALAKSHGIAATRLATTVLAEQLMFLLAGAFVGFLSLWLAGHLGFLKIGNACWQAISANHTWVFPILALIVLLSGLTIAVLLSPSLRGGLHARRKAMRAHLPRSMQILQLLVAHALLHVIIGAGLYLLLQQLMPESASALGLIGAIGALAIANIAGIAAVFAPAGLGVRELVLASLIATAGDFEAALAAAVLIRAITLVADASFSVVAISFGSLLERRTA